MEKVTFSIPAMSADRHVLAVREALGQADGVQEVIASSSYKDVLIKYDPDATSPEALAEALTSASYQVGAAPELSASPASTDDTSSWYQMQERKTETDRRDLAMSGVHR